MSIKEEIVIRSAVIYIMMAIFAVVILIRIVVLQFVEKDKWEKESEKYVFRATNITADRGDILAHDGRLLASSVPHYTIYMDTRSSGLADTTWDKGINGLSAGLSRIIGGRTAAEWKQKLITERKKGNKYCLIKRRIDYKTMTALKKLPIFKEGQYKGGLIIETSDKRILLNSDLASRTIGYVSKDGKTTKVGIEGAFNSDLAGTDGIIFKQRLTGGDWITVRNSESIPAKNGNDVISTLDIDLQDVASHALSDRLKTHNAHHGCAIVMEVRTGDIRAIVNLGRTGDGNYRETYNYAIGESTEPGSTFKLPVLMAALEDGLIDTADIIKTGNGVTSFYGKSIRDSKKGGFGTLTVKQVFEKSSNVGTAKIITQCYEKHPQDFVNRLYSFGINNKLGIQLKGEGEPLIRYPGDKLWSGLSLPMMSYGYEVQMTPLQILTFYNAVANDGLMMKPRFVSAISKNGIILKQFPPKEIKHSIASPSTIAKAKKMMEGVVEHGTATNLKNADYKIAGKTGTAQIAKGKGGYRTGRTMSYQASFVGYFPAENPLYSCIVVVNAPSNGVYYGNVVAGSVFREISDKIYATRFYKEPDTGMKDISCPNIYTGYASDIHTIIKTANIKRIKLPDTEWIKRKPTGDTLIFAGLDKTPDYVPDVKGMSLRDALYCLESSGYKVKFSGKGRVKQQSPQEGTKYYTGQVVTLELKLD